MSEVTSNGSLWIRLALRRGTAGDLAERAPKVAKPVPEAGNSGSGATTEPRE